MRQRHANNEVTWELRVVLLFCVGCLLFSESFCLCGKLGRGVMKTSLGVFADLEVTLMDNVSGVLEGLCDLVLSWGGVRVRLLIDYRRVRGGEVETVTGRGWRGGDVGDTWHVTVGDVRHVTRHVTPWGHVRVILVSRSHYTLKWWAWWD